MIRTEGLQHPLELALPDWLGPFIADWREPLEEEEQRMRLTIALASENVRCQTGGPFGAIVVDQGSGNLLGAGVNRVTGLGLSLAHAEMFALSLAQRRLGDWNLGAGGAVQLLA
jgi:tRNA(Arg) A34 adenosine deaminase TadA